MIETNKLHVPPKPGQVGQLGAVIDGVLDAREFSGTRAGRIRGRSEWLTRGMLGRGRPTPDASLCYRQYHDDVPGLPPYAESVLLTLLLLPQTAPWREIEVAESFVHFFPVYSDAS